MLFVSDKKTRKPLQDAIGLIWPLSGLFNVLRR
jgi:hypothetical protein